MTKYTVNYSVMVPTKGTETIEDALNKEDAEIRTEERALRQYPEAVEFDVLDVKEVA